MKAFFTFFLYFRPEQNSVRIFGAHTFYNATKGQTHNYLEKNTVKFVGFSVLEHCGGFADIEGQTWTRFIVGLNNCTKRHCAFLNNCTKSDCAFLDYCTKSDCAFSCILIEFSVTVSLAFYQLHGKDGDSGQDTVMSLFWVCFLYTHFVKMGKRLWWKNVTCQKHTRG